MTQTSLDSLAAEIAAKTNITAIAEDKAFRVNGGARHTFREAIRIAKQVHGRTGYALIKYSKHDGHGVGITEIGVNNTWMY